MQIGSDALVKGPVLSVRPATPGEAGLIQYAMEKVGMMMFGANLPSAFFLADASGTPFGGFQVYFGHAPPGVCGLASISFHSVPGFPSSWNGLFRGRRPSVELLKLLLEALPENVHRLEVLPRAEDRVSCAALERAGFTLEGILRAWYPWRGRSMDAAMYSWVRK